MKYLPPGQSPSTQKSSPVRHQGVQKKFRKERIRFGVWVQGLIPMRPQAFASAAAKRQGASEVGRKDLSPLWCWQAWAFAFLPREKSLDAQVRSQAVQEVHSAS